MMVFEKLSIEEKILDAIKELGFENPTPVQAEEIGRASCRERV